MKKRDSRNKQSNKGFTLVEVLVAILVLSIIVVPLLTAFVMSAKTNSKARQTMRATTVAQNVLEDMKSHSLEAVISMYQGNIAGGGAEEGQVVYTNPVLSAAEASFETALRNGTHYGVTTDVNGNIVGRENGRYDFVIKGTTHGGSGGSSKYDVEISVREPLADAGELDLANIVSMNRNDCAYYAQPEREHRSIGQIFEVLRGNKLGTVSDITAEEFQSDMTRTITIDMDWLGEDNQTVKVTYDYAIASGIVEEQDRVYSQYYTVFDNFVTKEPLQAVYLFYYPLYGVSVRDTIVINNPDNLDVDVFLISVRGEDYNVFNAAEYKANVHLNEGQGGGVAASGKAEICTNLWKASAGLAQPTLQMNLFFNGVGTNNAISVKDLGNAQATQNMYDVTIRVYKHDKSAFTSSDGQDIVKLKDSNRIVTITGTMLDKAEY